MKYKITPFEQFLLLVLNHIMYVSGVPAKHREELSCLLYRVAMKEEITDNDFKMFQ